jgi:hypothetical protein
MHTPYDEHGVPVSGGIPPIVRISGFIMIATIFVLLAMVFLTSHDNHVWPASASQTITLPKHQ